jgi:hypothetical protein
MPYAVLIAVALVAAACSSKDSRAKAEADAGAMHADAGKMPADAAPASALERATLPRPPSGGHLPAELRPPR